MSNKNISESDGPQDRPIVERPDWFFELAYPGGSRMPQVKRYIEFLEMELKLCKASKGPFVKVGVSPFDGKTPTYGPGVDLYRTSIVGKWHQNSFCGGQRAIASKTVTVQEFTLMETKGEICKRCKGPARAGH